MGEMRGAYRVFIARPEGKNLGVDERIILRWILETSNGGYGLD
jgi:hypothetical protein